MKITKVAVAGTLESSDVQVRVQPLIHSILKSIAQ